MGIPNPEGMGDVAGFKKGELRSGAHIRKTIPGEEAAEMQRHILESIIDHPAA